MDACSPLTSFASSACSAARRSRFVSRVSSEICYLARRRSSFECGKRRACLLATHTPSVLSQNAGGRALAARDAVCVVRKLPHDELLLLGGLRACARENALFLSTFPQDTLDALRPHSWEKSRETYRLNLKIQRNLSAVARVSRESLCVAVSLLPSTRGRTGEIVGCAVPRPTRMHETSLSLGTLSLSLSTSLHRLSPKAGGDGSRAPLALVKTETKSVYSPGLRTASVCVAFKTWHLRVALSPTV